MGGGGDGMAGEKVFLTSFQGRSTVTANLFSNYHKTYFTTYKQ